MISRKFKLRVAVVGCGIAGPAAALLLARQGHEVTIYERARELGPKGAGILLSPTGQFVLDQLGLLGDVSLGGSRIQRLVGHTKRGKKILDIRYSGLGTGVAGIGIHRGTLFQILLGALETAGIEIRRGAEVVSQSNSHLRLASDQVEGPFDLIIVSDGARSIFREALDPHSVAKPYSYGALWTSVENWGELPDNQLQQVFQGTSKMVGFLPTGKSPQKDGTKLVSIFWSIKLTEVDRWRETGLDDWKKEILDLAPDVKALIEQIGGEDSVTIASYLDSRFRLPFRDKVVLLGDAAHPMSPQLGQGASLALMDAWILADSLERERQVDSGLLTYGERRRRHVRYYQLASKWMTPAFQSDAEYLAPLRDLLLGPLTHIAPIRKQMELTMCGAKAGLFRSLKQEDDVLSLAARSALRLTG